MNKEEIKKIARETFIENVMNNLDSAIIFKYIQELEQENAQLKDKIDKAIEYATKEMRIVNDNEYHKLVEILKGDEE